MIGLSAALLGTDATAAVPPIRLIAEEEGSHVKLRVVGLSDAPYSARYSLDVRSGADGSGNSSTQSGQVRLAPGVSATLISLSVSAPSGTWNAKLRVEPDGGPAYEDVRRGHVARP
jgi:hypothetical protein